MAVVANATQVKTCDTLTTKEYLLEALAVAVFCFSYDRSSSQRVCVTLCGNLLFVRPPPSKCNVRELHVV
jgi:hypothetical protein